jgi:hypothetical protein
MGGALVGGVEWAEWSESIWIGVGGLGMAGECLLGG